MNWVNHIAQRKTVIVTVISLVAFTSLIVTSLSGRITADSFWHLQMGRDWLENGLSPWIDHYSFTYNGHKITNPPVLFQGLLHFITSHLGVIPGFKVFRLGLFLLTIGATVLLMRQIKATAISFIIVIPLIVLLLQLRVIIRPELFSYTLSIIALMLYFRADNKISTNTVAPMALLMLVWGNYHSSIFGYVIFFGFFLDCALLQFDSKATAKEWVKWFAWGCLLLVVGFLNHEYTHSVIQAITFSSEWKIRISEYLPPAPFIKSIAGVYVLIIFAILTPIAAYQQRRFGLLVIWAVFAFSAVNMQRIVTPAGIIIILMAAFLYSNNKNTFRLNLTGHSVRNSLTNLGIVISIGVVLYSNIERAGFYTKTNQSLIGQYPVALVDYMSKKHMTGPVFNHYGVGGYLIHRLAGQVQVYIDGRTEILYPLEHMKKYEQLMATKSPEVLRAELDKYSVDSILWEYSQSRQDLIQEMGGFGLDFLGSGFALYTRGKSNFPLFGKLLSHPQCWHSGMLSELTAEREKMDEILPAYSGLFPFADFVIGYSSADDGKAFFDASIEELEWMNEMRRFAGFRFLETGHYDLVAPLLGGVEIRRPIDYLASAFALIKAENIEVATQVVDEFSGIPWLRVQSEDVFIFYKLYQLIEMHRSLTSLEHKLVNELKAKLVELGYQDIDSSPALEVKSFCDLAERL